MEGDFKDICLFIIHKISLCPSFPKRGITWAGSKDNYKLCHSRKNWNPVISGVSGFLLLQNDEKTEFMRQLTN